MLLLHNPPGCKTHPFLFGRWREKTSLLLLGLGLALAAGCRESESPVLRIGEFSATAKDIHLRNAIARIYYPGETANVGFTQLKDAFTRAQILAQRGRKISFDEIREEALRIERTSQRPDLLLQIRKLFGEDRQAYYRIYILPFVADRLLREEVFEKDPAVHEETLNEAKAYLEAARRDPKTFNRDVRDPARGGTFTHTDDNPTGGRWSREVAGTLHRGAIFPAVVDEGYRWAVVRYLGPHPTGKHEQRFEAVYFPKLSYPQWVRREGARIQPEIALPPG